MKKRKLNKVISSSLASSMIIGVVSQNVNIVKASEIKNNIESETTVNEINDLTMERLSNAEGDNLLVDSISLPSNFCSNKIGDQTQTAIAEYNVENKNFTINGTGTYIGKDQNTTDNYHFVNYKIEGNATIIARLSDFDMSNAIYGQAGVFIRNGNTNNNDDYFGVYVEPSKNQYRYAYRENSNSGAAAISGLTAENKDKYIKIVKTGNSFRYYISDDSNFNNSVLTNSQTINNDSTTWYVGFVVCNGTNNTGNASAIFDNVIIQDQNGIVFSSDPKEITDTEDSKTEVNTQTLNITKMPSSTVSNKNVEFTGFVSNKGKVKLLLNGEQVDNELSLNGNDTFNFKCNLSAGRNSIDLYYITEDNRETVKTYSILYLTTQSYNIIVDPNYNGIDGAEENGVKYYKTITDAINSIDVKNKERKVIFIKNGTYKEKLTIESPYISLVGEDKNKTILTFDDANGTISQDTNLKLGTSKSASLYVKSKAFGFTAENLTIENSFIEKGNENEQAVALNNEADQSSIINCRLVGNQDTLLANSSSSKSARQYYYKCSIEGDVDFIFGRAQAVFDDCDIISLNRNSTTNNGYITAANTWDKDSYGYLIINSRLLGEEGIAENSVSLGRPWRPSSATQTVTPAVTYINCYMDSHITKKGWDDMGTDSLASTARFYEYGSYGPGYITSDTRNILTAEEKDKYTILNVFSKNAANSNGENAFSSDWNPQNTEKTLTNISINDLYTNSGTLEPNIPETNAPDVDAPEIDNSTNNKPDVNIPGNESGMEDTSTNSPTIDNNQNNNEIVTVSKKWIKNSDGTWSLLYNGAKLSGWQKVEEKWYYLNSKGIMQTGWCSINNKWYYLNNDGKMLTGWLKNGRNWYYLKADGSMATGWARVNNKWYYLKSNGSMATGWCNVNRKWYYLNNTGEMLTGWLKNGRNWYYLKADGSMATGWARVNNKWYYLKSNGSMATGWYNVNSKWYYSNTNGEMLTGWLKNGRNWYYLKADGSMASNTVINGYKLNANGTLSNSMI